MEKNFETLGKVIGLILWFLSMYAFKSCTHQTPQESIYPSAAQRQYDDPNKVLLDLNNQQLNNRHRDSNQDSVFDENN